jgi:hypothetical protein
MRVALAKEADRLNIPFQFNHVLAVRGGGLETMDLRDDFRDVLGVKYGVGWGSTRLYSVSAWRPNKSGTVTRECTFRS